MSEVFPYLFIIVRPFRKKVDKYFVVTKFLCNGSSEEHDCAQLNSRPTGQRGKCLAVGRPPVWICSRFLHVKAKLSLVVVATGP